MTPYKLSLENWLLKLNPCLTPTDLYKHEEYIGKAIQLSMEIELKIRSPKSLIKSDTEPSPIEEYLMDANTIIPKKKMQIISNFWMKQKEYASVQRDFQRFELLRWKIWMASFFYYLSYIQLAYNLILGKKIVKKES